MLVHGQHGTAFKITTRILTANLQSMQFVNILNEVLLKDFRLVNPSLFHDPKTLEA